MQHILRNVILIGLVLVLCLLALNPPSEKLRKGKDLAGGTSLVYTVDIQPGDPDDVLERTIEVLKERINPNGLFEISFVPVGRNRIEITMPLPGEKSAAMKAEYEAALEELKAFELDRTAFQRAMRRGGQDRVDAIDALATSGPLDELLSGVRQAAQEYATLRAAFDALPADADTGEREALVQQTANAGEVLEAAESQVLRSVVTRQQVRSALTLSDKGTRIIDKTGGPPAMIPSPREASLASIRERLSTFDGGEAALDKVLEAYDEYEENRSGFDDPAELQRLLSGSGVLEYRIAPRVNTLANEQALRAQFLEDGRNPDGYKWFPLKSLDKFVRNVEEWEAVQADAVGFFGGQAKNDKGEAIGHVQIVEERDGTFYVLLSDQPGQRLTGAEGEWSVAQAFADQDEYGRPAIGFRMDALGSRRMGELTGNNLQQPMAILLDGYVYSWPNINGRISSRGIIQGNFSQEEITYTVRTLNAGALQAKLSESPISVKTLAPTLGQDNLERGLRAAWIALAVVVVFMVFYYFSYGLIASVSLIVNAIIILGCMSAARAAFTLPGIAGIVLTFGMAVDANVLIYERVREELAAGSDLRIAVRTAFKKVLSTIVDANVTNLIVCVVLAYTATQEIKGFAITLGIGVIATMFSSLFVTRVIFTLLIEKVGVRKMSQLPIAVPAIDRVLSPRIDWIKLRPVFLVISLIFVGFGVAMIVKQGANMLDTEFRGGTKLTPQFTQVVSRQEVADRLDASAAEAAKALEANPDDVEAKVLSEFNGSLTSIVPVDPEADGVRSDEFELRTVLTEDGILGAAVTRIFADMLDTRPKLEFNGSEAGDQASAPVFNIADNDLGKVLQGQDVIAYDVSAYGGGLAILLDDISPVRTRDQLSERLTSARRKAGVADDALSRETELVVLEGTDDAVTSAVVLVHQGDLDTGDATALASFRTQEWEITREALTVPQTLSGVERFSPAMASTFKAQAIVALVLSMSLILVYIWIRFGSVRYSLAAITAIVHDVLAVIGLIAFAEILYDMVPAVAAIGIQPFRIDLGLVAALMTIIGYSLNDTIIILDRVRENRGRLPYATRETINLAINQTISRTIITSGTTFLAVLVLFLVGGQGIASFTYALLCGVVVGTYSSVAVAAPLVFTSKVPPSVTKVTRTGARASEELAPA